MKKLQLGKDALMLSVLTLITVLTWIGFDVYRALTKTEIPKVLQRQIIPLNPKLPTTTLEGLQQRVTFTQEELRQIPPPPEEEATESGTVATESGILE